MIGSLLYVTTTRPNVMQAVGSAIIFQSSPKETNVDVVKRFIIYLKGTMDYGLWIMVSKKK